MSGRWVLFDLDGTLFDYAAAEYGALLATLARAGVATDADVLARYRASNAAQWSALERGETTPARLRVDRWRPLFEDGDEALLARVADDYIRQLAAGAQLLDGAAEVVAQVAATHRVAYITNGLADVQRPRLAASPLAELGEVLVISDEVGAAKPDAAIFDIAFERMGHPARAAVTMVGDSLAADVAGGLAYGMPTVWVAPQPPPALGPHDPVPTHTISSLRELPELLQGA